MKASASGIRLLGPNLVWNMERSSTSNFVVDIYTSAASWRVVTSKHSINTCTSTEIRTVLICNAGISHYLCQSSLVFHISTLFTSAIVLSFDNSFNPDTFGINGPDYTSSVGKFPTHHTQANPHYTPIVHNLPSFIMTDAKLQIRPTEILLRLVVVCTVIALANAAVLDQRDANCGSDPEANRQCHENAYPGDPCMLPVQHILTV